jgi:hypothetical protein
MIIRGWEERRLRESKARGRMGCTYEVARRRKVWYLEYKKGKVE